MFIEHKYKGTSEYNAVLEQEHLGRVENRFSHL